MQLNEDELLFHGNSEIERDIRSLETPYQFFCIFFLKIFNPHIAEQTNLYCVQKYTEMYRNRYTRSYWSYELDFNPINSTMSIIVFRTDVVLFFFCTAGHKPSLFAFINFYSMQLGFSLYGCVLRYRFTL